MHILMVEWVDSISGSDWIPLFRAKEETVSRVCSIGILIKETEKEIVLLPNVSENQARHQIAIPRGAIKRMRRLEIGK